VGDCALKVRGLKEEKRLCFLLDLGLEGIVCEVDDADEGEGSYEHSKPLE